MRFDYGDFDPVSYQIGVLECFAGLVKSGRKRLALSHTLEAEALPEATELVTRIADAFDIKYHTEYNMVGNLIASDAYIQDKYVFLLYRDDQVIREYSALKERERQAKERGVYNLDVKKDITASLCRLLSYPEEYIREKYL